MTRRTLRVAVALVTAIACTATVAACTSARSEQAYCAAVQQHKQRYISAMKDASQASAMSALIESAGAIGDLQTMWSDLAKVAPTDIETDSETVRDAWTKVQDDAGDQNVLGAMTTALSSAPAMSRVNSYIAKHCGVDAAPAG